MLRDRLETVVSFEAWVIGGVSGQGREPRPGCGRHRRWLDLPVRTWLPRLVRRSLTHRHSPRHIVLAVIS